MLIPIEFAARRPRCAARERTAPTMQVAYDAPASDLDIAGVLSGLPR
ncbi:hypothetical protein [Sphingopyxis macrogoltabida]|nr:hypothetical protein [Sphingopyxis macrogoltabida]